MTTLLEVEFPATLTLHAKNRAAVEQRSRFLLGLKYFELGEVSSGQAAKMCGMGKVASLADCSLSGVPESELEGEELEREFADG